MRYLFIFFLSSYTLFAQNIDNVKQIVKDLSSEKYAGRGYMKDGINKAAKYISKEFVKFGLEKFDDDYFQDLSFNMNCITDIEVKIDSKKLVPGSDYVVRRGAPSKKGTYRLLHISPDYLSDIKKLETILPTKKREYIPVIDFDDMMENQSQYDTCLKKVFGSMFEGFIFTHTNELKDYVAFGNKQRQRFILNIRKNAINNSDKELALEIESEYGKIETKNVCGLVRGQKYPDSLIIICGHYDHLGSMGPNAYFPGADDNASSIAVMIELADYFSKNKQLLDKSVMFVAFTGEEAGLLGSQHFVENFPYEKSNINFVINADMIGFGEEGLYVWNGLNQPGLADKILAINKEQNYLDTILVKENTPLSDHYSFTEVGIPAIFLTTGVDASKHYHTVFDTYENTSFLKTNEIMLLIADLIQNSTNIKPGKEEKRWFSFLRGRNKTG